MSSKRPTHVTGLDLSLTGTGIATIELATGLTSLHLHGSKGKKGAPLEARIARMQDAVAGVIRHIPAGTFIVIEAPSFGSASTSAHERAGMWWRVVAFAAGRGHEIASVAPRSRAKYAAGHLPAAKPRSGPDKREVLDAMRTDHPFIYIANDNVADGLALAAAGARHFGAPIDPSTKQRLEVVAAIRWPASTTNPERSQS